MRAFDAIILQADISGYTEFLVLNRSSLLHAEQIITEFMETVTRTTAFPLKLQKLEGKMTDALNDVMRQVVQIMQCYQD